MSIYGLMRTSLSGMNAQSNKMSTVSDNIANQNTAGYKRASTEFSSLMVANGNNSYNSGAVSTTVRYEISNPGTVQYTTSDYDLAIEGSGFFAVSGPGGTTALTRAGAFVPVVRQTDEGSVTQLVNTAGYTLLGQRLPASGLPDSLQDPSLVPVELGSKELKAAQSTAGTFKANLPLQAAVRSAADPDHPLWTIDADTPPADGTYDAKASMTVYDPLGTPKTLDIYFQKTGVDTWDVAVYDRANAGGQPTQLAVSDITFDPATGEGGIPPLNLSVPHGTTPGAANNFPFTLDMSELTQLSASYSVYESVANGNAASALERLDFASDGTVYEVYTNGSRNAAYRIPLAAVASPDRLEVGSGNVFTETQESGRIQFGSAESLGYGSLQSGALEQSNVDMGAELADMIQAQSAFGANSKVFQAGSELLDTLLTLKR